MKKKTEKKQKVHIRSIRVWHEGDKFYGFLNLSKEPFGTLSDKLKVGPHPSAEEVLKEILKK